MITTTTGMIITLGLGTAIGLFIILLEVISVYEDRKEKKK